MQGGEQATRASAAGQDDLFGGGAATAARPLELPEWPERVRLAGERETLGAVPHRASHPALRSGAAATGRRRDWRTSSASRRRPQARAPRYSGGRQVSAAGLIYELRKRNGRTSFVLDDRTGRIEVTLFEEQAKQYPRAAGEGCRGAGRGQPALR